MLIFVLAQFQAQFGSVRNLEASESGLGWQRQFLHVGQSDIEQAARHVVGLSSVIIGPFGLWIKGRWRDGFKWLGIWLLILVPLALIYMGAPGDYGIVAVALGLWILAYIGLLITTVIHTVRARVGAEPQPSPIVADLTVAKALDEKQTESV